MSISAVSVLRDLMTFLILNTGFSDNNFVIKTIFVLWPQNSQNPVKLSFGSFEVNRLVVFPRVLILFILMDFPMHVDRISMEFSILYFKGSQVEIFKL